MCLGLKYEPSTKDFSQVLIQCNRKCQQQYVPNLRTLNLYWYDIAYEKDRTLTRKIGDSKDCHEDVQEYMD